MSEEHVVRVKDNNVVCKYLNKLSSKSKIAKLIAIFVGALVLAFTLWGQFITYSVIEPYYNDVTALTAWIFIIFCYLSWDLIYTSLTKPDKEVIRDNEKKYMKENLEKENKELSDENERLRTHLKWMQNENYESLLIALKSQSMKTKQGLSQELENFKYWVVENMSGEPNELTRLENENKRLMAKNESMLKKMGGLAAEVKDGNRILEKLDVITEKFERLEKNDGYQAADAYNYKKKYYQ